MGGGGGRGGGGGGGSDGGATGTAAEASGLDPTTNKTCNTSQFTCDCPSHVTNAKVRKSL